MSPRTWARAPLALAAALAAVLLAGAPALAAPPPIPADVQAIFDGAALQQARAGGAGVDADFTGAQVAAVHEVFSFSEDFLAGRPTPEPVTSAEHWLGALTRGDEVLCTLGVWRNGDAPARPNGYSDDVDTGRALTTLTSTEILVVDEPNGAYYAIDGTTVRPLNDWAERVLPRPAGLSRLQEPLAERYAELRAQPMEGEVEPPGVTIAVVGMALTLLVGLAVVAARRRRRPARSA